MAKAKQVTILGESEIQTLLELRLSDKGVSFTRIIPIDVMIKLTLEEQPCNAGFIYRISFCCPRPRFVSQEAVRQILRAMNLNFEILDAEAVYLEKDVADCNGDPADAIALIFQKES